MPTSTATVTVSFNGPKVTKLPVSTKKKGAATKHTVATLRSLYNRAAKAFIQRDMVLTYSLITSAFSNLHSPVSSSPDSLNSQRRKWDVLRVTLEATVYTSNTPSPVSLLPESLQMTLRLSPPSVIATMHTRSLQLFTPSNHSRPTAEFLPSQVLVTLALASVKLDCPQVGREIVEDWLHRRNNRPSEELSQDSKLRAEALDGYEKVIEVYCLHLLPRMGEWDYIREFLAYERELLEERRMQLLRTVERLHSEYVTGIDHSRQQERVPSVSFSPSSPSPSTSSSRTATPKVAPNTPSSSNPDRAPSPSPSVTSASTTSTHTAVPTRRPNGLQPATSSTTPTPLTQSPVHLRPPRSITDSTTSTIQRPAHVVSPQSHKAVSSSYPSSSSSSSEIISSRSVSQPSLITLIRSTLIPHLTKSKISFFVIMCLVSFVSYLFRLRRKRLRVLSSTGSSSATTPSKLITFHAGDLEEVRRRLGGTGLWAGAKRAIYDVARMAVGGLA